MQYQLKNDKVIFTKKSTFSLWSLIIDKLSIVSTENHSFTIIAKIKHSLINLKILWIHSQLSCLVVRNKKGREGGGVQVDLLPPPTTNQRFLLLLETIYRSIVSITNNAYFEIVHLTDEQSEHFILRILIYLPRIFAE